MVVRRRPPLISLKRLKQVNKFYVPHVVAINNLHNIYFVTNLARQSIIEQRENLIDERELDIEIQFPDIHGNLKPATKNRSQTRKVLKNAIRHDLYSNSLISSVAATEAYLEEIARMCLLKEPIRLGHSVKKQGKKQKLTEPEIEVKVDESSVPLRTVLDAQTLENIYSTVVSDKLHQLMYASPLDYFGYLKNALGLEPTAEVVDAYIEIKATRDLLTHNQGYVNETYITKAGDIARSKDVRQRLPLTPEYFAQSIGTMKRIVGDVYKEASREYLGVTSVRELYPAKQS